MKKFCKLLTLALVCGVALSTFVACGATPTADTFPPEQNTLDSADTTPNNDSCGQDCACQPPVVSGCDQDCDCQPTVDCDHDICDHVWKQTPWLSVPDKEHPGKIINIYYCIHNNNHLMYEIVDDTTTNPAPSFTLEDLADADTTWQSDTGTLTFHQDGTFDFSGDLHGTWTVIDATTVKLTFTDTGTTQIENQYKNLTLTFDRAATTLHLADFYGTEYTFLLDPEAV